MPKTKANPPVAASCPMVVQGRASITMDGKLLLVTNAADLRPDEVVSRYKSLADIERGFRVLKSKSKIEIDLNP